jgi:hypothetical protein
VLPAGIFEDLSPHARVATAVLPFAAAMLLRLILGKNWVTGMLISLSTTWFAINVLMAPLSEGMQRDIFDVRSWFR